MRMKLAMQLHPILLTLIAISFPFAAFAQNPQASRAAITYDPAREVSLIGTVQSFTPASQTPPLGAHLLLQTTKGPVDVHLGDARLLAASQFTIRPGDTLRIIGEELSYANGTQFFARILQKGTQVLAVRSPRGIPLSYARPRDHSALPQAEGKP